MMKNIFAYFHIHNEERSWATWDHYPIYARIQEDGHSKNLKKRDKEVDWMETEN